MAAKVSMGARYRAALQAAISSESKAYGFTLVIWGTGALLVAERGAPAPLDVVSYVGGALVAMGAVLLISFGGPTARWTPTALRHLAFGAVHLGSVAAALGVGWALAVAIATKWFAYFAAGCVATAVYQLVLALEIATTSQDRT